MKLVILESPNKISTIKKYLPDDFEVLASVGHIMEIPADSMNINIADGTFAPVIRPIPGKEDTIKLIQFKAKQADEVFICTDPDREGERIALDIYEILEDKSKVKRAAFHEITKKAVAKAINEAGDIDFNRAYSQMARQIIDRVLGYTVSPMVWKSIVGGKSAGRVQSVALGLIAEREAEIDSFVRDLFWDITVGMKIGGENVFGVVSTNNKGNRIYKQADAERAKEIIEKSELKVSNVSKSIKARKAQAPFDTASLQKLASTNFGWSGKKTMDVAQKLYEKGMCTYHRTDSFSVSTEAQEVCSGYIKTEHGDDYVPKTPNVYKKKGQTSQEAHECIRPTSVRGDSWINEPLEKDEQRLIDMITNRFVASQMSDLRVKSTVITIPCKPCKIIVEGKSIEFDGWSKVWQISGKEVFLPNIEENDTLDLNGVVIKDHETRPPERYNTGTLVSKMEKHGVGRPSTWAQIIENIVGRGYVENDGKRFALTSIGKDVYTFLVNKFRESFMDLGYTSTVEAELDKICKDPSIRVEVISNFYDNINRAIKKSRRVSLGI